MKRYAALGSAIVIAGMVSLSGCSKPAEKADTAKIADAIKADVKELVAAFNAHDAAKAVSHDAPDVVAMFHGSPNVVGAEADLALTKQQLTDPAAKVEVSGESVDVAASGEMAVYRATYSYTMTDPTTKKLVTEPGNWLLGYKTQPDGSWKIAWNVVSSTGPTVAAK